MDKTNLKKLEDITREIIETLEEEMPEDKSGMLCAKNRNSPFRQLVGLLEMEMDSIRIMYSDLPLPAIAAEEKESRKTPEEAEAPIQKEPNRQPEPPRPKFTPRPASDRPREPATTSEPQTKPKPAPVKLPATESQSTATTSTQPAPASNKTADQNFAATAKIKPQSSPPASPNSRNTKLLLAAGVVILLLLAGLIMLRKEPTQQQTAKVVVNWSDVEKGKSHASELKDKVTPQNKKQAKSFYTLGNKELGNKNLRAAREYFRTAVSLDPSSEEYMESYRQVDYIMRKKNTPPPKP